MIWNQKMDFEKFFYFQFLFFKWQMKNEKLSKFVLFLNHKTNHTFGTRIPPSVYKTFIRFSIDLKFHNEFLILNWKLNWIKNRVRIQFSTKKFNWKSNERFIHGFDAVIHGRRFIHERVGAFNPFVMVKLQNLKIFNN